MDVKVIARLSGVSPESVVDHQQVKGADILRIDLRKEPELRRSIEARAAGKVKLPDGDIFETDRTVDGTARKFEAERMDKYRTYEWVQPGPGEPRIPGWRLQAEVSPPNCPYGAAIEYIGIYTFDRHSGSTTYNLALPNEDLSRPWMRYTLGYLDDIDHLKLIGVSPTSGNIEVNHIDISENAQELSGAFAQVQFDMPNIHEHLPQAPDRGFQVYLPNGFYRLNGTW